jgi:hypothetical protein
MRELKEGELVCPCCKGDGYLIIDDANHPGFPYHADCCHCDNGIIRMDNMRIGEPINE